MGPHLTWRRTQLDLADTFPLMCQNDTVIAETAGEAPKPHATTYLSFWNSVGARPKSSTPARTWSNVVCRRGKSSSKFKAPAFTPPPEVSLHNRYNPLTTNTMCDTECNGRMNKVSRDSPKTQPRAN